MIFHNLPEDVQTFFDGKYTRHNTLEITYLVILGTSFLSLIHWGQDKLMAIMQIVFPKIVGHHWFNQLLVTCMAPSHDLSYSHLMIWTLETNLSKAWIKEQIFFKEMTTENVICTMPAILPSLQCIKYHNNYTNCPVGSYLIIHNITETTTTPYQTRMWNMISSPATPTVCLEQKSENFQSRNVTLSMPSQSKN